MSRSLSELSSFPLFCIRTSTILVNERFSFSASCLSRVRVDVERRKEVDLVGISDITHIQ